MGKIMIIIDCNYICHKIKFALINAPLSVEGFKTEIIFGFLRQILVVAQEFPEEKTWVFAWDSRVNNRKAIYPDYKKKRLEKKTREEKELESIAYDQFTELRLYTLPSIGFKNIFIQKGYEADDIIASIVMLESYDKNKIIVSSDQDLYQLLPYESSIFDVKKKSLYTKKDFEQEYGIGPHRWAVIKAYAGCSSDNIKGIERVGEKTAIKYLNNQLKNTTMTQQRIESKEGQKIFNRNFPLVRLPLEGTNSFPIGLDRLTKKDFSDTFEKYRLNSFLQRKTWDNWETFFDLQ